MCLIGNYNFILIFIIIEAIHRYILDQNIAKRYMLLNSLVNIKYGQISLIDIQVLIVLSVAIYLSRMC